MDENEEPGQSLETTTVDRRPVELHFCKGKILVWDADDVRLLRETHHIIGALVGSLPRSPRQNAQLGLPLQLMPEEAAVLVEYDVARLVNVKVAEPSADDASAFGEARQRSFNEQQALWDALSLKKKQDFAHIVAMGRTTKKHRRAERAKKQKRNKATSSSVASIGDGSMLDGDGGDIKRRRVQHDAGATATGPQDNMQEPVTAVDQDGPSNTGLAASKQSTSFSNQKENSINDAVSCSSNCMETGDTHTDESSRTDRTCVRTHPAQGGQPDTTSSLETDTSVNATRNSDGVTKSIDAVGEEERSGGKSVSEITETVLSSESGSLPRIPSAGSEDKQSSITAERISDRLEMTPTINVKGSVTDNDFSQAVQSDLCEDSALCDRQSNKTSDPGARSNTEPDRMIDREGYGSPPLANHEAQSDSVGVFKKPSDPQPCLGYLVHIVTASSTTPKQEVTEWAFPSTKQEILKYRVFKDLWETGYYLTSGCKFGGDFLVYPGDPFLFHSDFIAICMPHEKTLSPLDLISYGRLGTNVKKTVILCSVDAEDEVVYTSLQWTGIS